MIAVSSQLPMSVDINPIDACSLDDERVLLLDAEGHICEVSLTSHEVTQKCEASVGGNRISLSPNREILACAGPEGFALFKSDDGKLLESRRGSWSSVAKWHESGNRVLFTFGKSICVTDSYGVPIVESENFSSTVTDASWIGDKIAVAAYGGVSVSDEQGSKFIKREFVGSLLCLSASPTGDWIVSGNQDASLQVYKVSDDTRLEMQGFPRKVTIAEFNLDGKWLANNGADEVTVWSFAGKGPKGRSPVILPKHVGGGTAISWSKTDANLIATGDSIGQLRVWDLKLGLEGKPLYPRNRFESMSNSPVKSILWDSHGSSIIAVHNDGIIYRRETS